MLRRVIIVEWHEGRRNLKETSVAERYYLGFYLTVLSQFYMLNSI